MARTILAVVLIALVNILVGCHRVDSGSSQLMPPSLKAATVTKGSEADIIEHMASNRQGYRNGLQSLIAHYKGTGNYMKQAWARSELKKLEEIPQYKYIIGASFPGPDLKATTSIPLADYMFEHARRLEKKAGQLIIIKDEDLLRKALAKYDELVEKHPTSDKIDDAAFRAGKICEYFKDYTVALVYYQRVYQWNPRTVHPAEYKAAYILDKRMSRRAEALELYQRAVKKAVLSQSYKELAEKRIAELTKSGETLE